MNNIEHFLLPEHTNQLYKKEAISSISLTRNVADKINELVDAYNELSKVNLDKIHEQDGTIRKAIIYLKDNLINTLHDLTEILENEGFFDKTVYKYVSTLESRVNNLISSIPDGGTTSDAELLDIRVNNEGTTYDNAGESVRAGYSALSNRMDNTSIYSLDLVKKFIGHKEIYSGDIEFFHGVASERWEYAHKTFNAPAGRYTIVVDDCNIPPAGYLKIAHTITGIKFTEAITKPGTYQFTLYDVVPGFTERTILFQTSTDELSNVGLYYARGIHIYEGWITEQQGLPDYFTGADKRLPMIPGKNLFNPENITAGYYLKDNGIETKEFPEYPGFYYSEYIPIESGESYAITIPHLGGAFICFYEKEDMEAIKNADGSYSSWNGEMLSNANGIIKAPLNAKFLRISGKIEDVNITQVEHGLVQTSFEPFTNNAPLTALELRVDKLEATSSNAVKKVNTVDSVSTSSLPDGFSLRIESPHSKCGHSIGFTATFDSFNGELTISHGKVNPYCSAYMILSADTIKIYSYEAEPKLIASVNHGLTLSEYVYVDITTEYKKAHIRVTSSGADFELDTEWNGSNGNIIAEVSGMTLTNCTLSYFIKDLDKDLWLFGDSYFDHWCEYANEYGYNGAMLDAYSGRGSFSALDSLQKCLRKATPKKIAWFMGMNDADSSTAANSNWLSVFNTLKEICENNGIELIISTVPNVPGRSHEFKNEIVRNSGYRYIDVCHSVGADSSGSWYDGLLSGDNVHASELGRMVMANYIITMLPELKG